MIVKVYADKKLTKTDLEKIKGIMRESNCPNESLHNTFPTRYHGIDGDTIQFDSLTWGTQGHVYTVEY